MARTPTRRTRRRSSSAKAALKPSCGGKGGRIGVRMEPSEYEKQKQILFSATFLHKAPLPPIRQG
jgi:hypothetical protein